MDAPYYFSVRHDLIGLIPKGANRILEVGCAAGMTGKALKEAGFDEVVGIECIEEIARRGEGYYDRLFIGDVEQIELPYAPGHFDCILYPDVLEHLRDPWNTLKKHSAMVRAGGTVICSIPNIRHYRVMKKLAFKGKFEYESDGIMDKTHLRFFTLSSIRELLIDAGFEPLRVIKKPSGAAWLKMVNRVTGGRLIDCLVRQYIVLAQKKGTR
ncbi:MAG TPA: class I SAM-dependent methyltransferase [Syntrophorhabdaceae bacterium]|nr:class I SAM-dependent methyltransferase [Syntrophorhabdaceae bacterium]